MSCPFASAHDETDGGSGAAAEVQGAESSCALDLIVTGRAADLLGRVEKHPHAGGPDRMSAADESTAGVDRKPPADLDLAVFDGFPGFARAGQSDVVDGQVLAGVKQSCTSNPSTSSRLTCARRNASSTADRTWGST